MRVAAPPSPAPVAVCAALADDTRWDILSRLGERSLSATELAEELPISRQAIARHLAVLAEVGLVEQAREGRQLRFRAVGQRLSELARDLDALARAWGRRLDRLRTIAEARAARPGEASGP